MITQQPRKKKPGKKNGDKKESEIVVMTSEVIIAGMKLYKKVKPILKRKGKKGK